MPVRQKVTLTIIIPIFNEDKTILRLLERIRLIKLPGIRKEILIVDDGSTDQTAKLLEGAKIPNCRIFRHETNQGKGAAIRTVKPHVTGNFIIVQDGDLEYDPTDYSALLAPLLQGKADVVFGSRFMSSRPSFSVLNYWANKFLTFLANLFYSGTLTDMETGYKVFKNSIFQTLNWRANGFGFDPEITANVLKRKLRLFEVPIAYAPRDTTEGKKITWQDGFAALFYLFRCRFID